MLPNTPLPRWGVRQLKHGPAEPGVSCYPGRTKGPGWLRPRLPQHDYHRYLCQTALTSCVRWGCSGACQGLYSRLLLLLSLAVFLSCVASPKPGPYLPAETGGLSPALQVVVPEREANQLLLSLLPSKEGITVTIYFLLVGQCAQCFCIHHLT